MTLKQTSFEERQFKTIDTWMPTGRGTNLPDVLQGIYFMDGNPLPEDCVTLNSTWDAENRTLRFKAFEPHQWTFQATAAGRIWLSLVRILGAGVEIRFQDDTLRHAVVRPTMYGLFSMPRFLMEWTMTQTQDSVNGETWDRRNTIFFRLIPTGGYVLRKIVDHKGQKTAAFNQMLTQVQETCLVVVDPELNDEALT